MPLYHCDYCDKEFQDTPAARKRHLQSISHLRSRKLWYDSLGVAEQHESLIQPSVCQHFVRTGTCKFGEACKFFHPKPVIVDPIQVTSGLNSGENSNRNPSFFNNPPIQNHALPASNWGNLPPSLQPPPEGGYPALPFIDWG